MKHFPAIAMATVALLLGSCMTSPSAGVAGPAAIPAPVASAAAKDSPITMENLDLYLGRADVEVVDLRNFEDRFNSGYITGTENIPFFQYLENRLVTRGMVDGKPASWDLSLATINDNFPVGNFFNKDKAVILFCASGTRAAYIKSILDKKGYRTYNAGGFKDYKGLAKVLGDGEYKLPAPAAH